MMSLVAIKIDLILRSPFASPFETGLAALLRMRRKGVSKDDGRSKRSKFTSLLTD
jgi:hypothetical protein